MRLDKLSIAVLVVAGTVLPPPSAALVQEPAPSWIAAEQDGQSREPFGGELRLRRAPFTLLLTVPGGVEVHVHASESAAASEAVRSGGVVDAFFADGAALAIDLLNTSKTLFLASDGRPAYHAWFYEAPDDHTFDSVAVRGKDRQARFTVANLARPDPAHYTIERFPGREVFLTFRLVGANRVERSRDAVRIVLIDPAPRPAGDQLEKDEPTIRLSPDAAPKKVKHVEPVYPDQARAARIQGTVHIEATVAKDGSVREAKIVRSVPLLDAAALEAVKQWQFEPLVIDGMPRTVIMTVSVHFSLR